MRRKMPKLTCQSMFRKGEKVKESIVDVLTTNEARTSVWQPTKEGKIISEIIGINSVSQGKPVKLIWPESYERGFQNPEKQDRLYLINAERRVITCAPNNFNLFYDQDKVSDKNRYVWHGTFDEILNEFRKDGYALVSQWRIN